MVPPRTSPAANALFTLIGFMGIYFTILAILFLFLVYREIEEGPERPLERSNRSLELCHGNRLVLPGRRHDRDVRGPGRLRSRRRRRSPLRGAHGCRAPAPSSVLSDRFGVQEVWLLAGAARSTSPSPPYYASSFSGFTAVMVVLWLLISARHRHRIPRARAEPGLAAVMGRRFRTSPARAGHLLRRPLSATSFVAYPLDRAGTFFLPLWTDFNPSARTPAAF